MVGSAKALAWAQFVACGVLLVGCGEGVMGKPRDAGNGSGSDDSGGGGGCTANEALRCDGINLVSCNSDGTGEVMTACSLRCNATSHACENKVAPSNAYAAQLDAAATEPALNLTANTSVVVTTNYNPTAGTFSFGPNLTYKAALVPGANGGPEVVVVSMNSLSIAANVKLTISSESAVNRQIAFMSAGDVSIAGTIERGPSGAFNTADGCNSAPTTGTGADPDYPGSGGGGFGTAGGAGGAVGAAGGAGGTTSGDVALVPLRGGCKAGNTGSIGGGGSGGGAIQITSATSITISGAITAPGYGGSVNAGGGSGGAILLEAPTVTISGGVYANGGAGGCGEFSSGNNGSASTQPAAGGPCNNGHSGGNGGAGTTAPTAGDSLTNVGGTQQYAPGGGGAVGRIRINTLSATVAGTGAQSPPASIGSIGTR